MSKTIAVNVNGMISGFRLVTMQRDENHEKPITYPKGRKCRVCDCNLSIYNSRRFCAQHENFDARRRPTKEAAC